MSEDEIRAGENEESEDEVRGHIRATENIEPGEETESDDVEGHGGSRFNEPRGL